MGISGGPKNIPIDLVYLSFHSAGHQQGDSWPPGRVCYQTCFLEQPQIHNVSVKDYSCPIDFSFKTHITRFSGILGYISLHVC